MSQKYTAKEVRAEADFLSTYSRKPSQMLTAFADSIERAQGEVPAVVITIGDASENMGGTVLESARDWNLSVGVHRLFTHPPAQPADSGRSYATSWTDEEKARAFEWLRAAATADGAPMEAGVALDTWHALAAQGRPASPAGVPDGIAVPDNIRDLLAHVYGMGASHGHHYTVEGGYTAYTRNEWRDAYREAIDTAIDEDAETFAALPVLAKPVAQGEVRLWDTQWMNIVNHDNCYRDWDKSDAINHAVKMTEQAIARNVIDGKLPPPRITAAPSAPEGDA